MEINLYLSPFFWVFLTQDFVCAYILFGTKQQYGNSCNCVKRGNASQCNKKSHCIDGMAI